jgi:hypothetical protein
MRIRGINMKKMIMNLLINKMSSRREKMKRVGVKVRVRVGVRVRVERVNRMRMEIVNKMIWRKEMIKINFMEMELEIRLLIIQKLILMV